MLVYHGTTAERAKQICKDGFLPKKPSRRVWFAEAWSYALRRARQQARRSKDRPVVLTCELDRAGLRARYGSKRVVWQNGVIAIKGGVPVAVLRSFPAPADQPSSPKELAEWVNEVLRRKRGSGVDKHHRGILRLSQWVVRRLAHNPKGIIRPSELFDVARRYLPEEFARQQPSEAPRALSRMVQTIEVEAAVTGVVPVHEEKAFELMTSAEPKDRVKGLKTLAELGDPDLQDWCGMFYEDESVDVQVAALRLLLRCEAVETEDLLAHAEDDNKRVRAAALAALAKFSGEDSPLWFRRGLEDPEPCVRVEVAALLDLLDPSKHTEAFLLALHDPNPDIERRARELTAGKGYRKATSGWAYKSPREHATG